MTPVELALAGAVAAVFSVLVWFLKAMWELLAKSMKTALDDIRSAIKEQAAATNNLADHLMDLSGQVREVRDDVSELTPPPISTQDEITAPLGRALPGGGRESGRYHMGKKRGGNGG